MDRDSSLKSLAIRKHEHFLILSGRFLIKMIDKRSHNSSLEHSAGYF